MPNGSSRDSFDHKKIYQDLIDGCKKVRAFDIKCIVDEGWTGFYKKTPFPVFIIDGIVICRVVAPSLNEARSMVADEIPVIRFLEE